MSTFKSFIVYLIIIICLIVSITKIFKSITVYLNYDTYVTTDYIFDNYFIGYHNLPGITLCGVKAQLVSEEYYNEKYGRSVDRPIGAEESFEIMNALNEMSVKQQFEALYSTNQLKQLIELKVNSADDREWKGDIKIISALNSELFCFSFVQDQYNAYGRGLFVSIEVKLKIPEFLLFIHSSVERLFNIKEHRYELIDLTKDKVTNVYFDKTVMRQLPAPYTTNCHEYGNSTASAFHQACLLKGWEANQHKECWPQDYLSYEEREVKICSKDKQVEMKKSLDQTSNICSITIKQNCYHEYYSLTQNKALTSANEGEDHLINVLPVKEHKEINYSPIMVMSDAMVQLLDVVCLWLGFIGVYLLGSVRLERTLTKVHSMRS